MPTTDNLKNLCTWVRRNYPQLKHLTNEDLAILPLQEWWERDHRLKLGRAQVPASPAELEPRKTPPPPTKPPLVPAGFSEREAQRTKAVLAKQPQQAAAPPPPSPKRKYVSPCELPPYIPVITPPEVLFPPGSTAYKMRQIEIAQRKRVAAKHKPYRPSASSAREWPEDPSQGWHNNGPRGSITNPWPGGKCSPK
jgi:hypothetical protein